MKNTTWRNTGLCVLVVICAVYISRFLVPIIYLNSLKGPTAVSYDIVIGIPSARNHFQQRQTLRDTWVGHVQNNSRLHVTFVVGKRDCQIPPEYRVDQFSCQPINISGKCPKEEVTAIEGHTGKYVIYSNPQRRLKFKVLYPIVIRKLGILKEMVQNSESSSPRIVLVDDVTEEEVISVKMSFNSPGVEILNYYYKKTQPFLLPKEFEGSILIGSSESEDSSVSACSGFIPSNTKGDFIQFTQDQWFVRNSHHAYADASSHAYADASSHHAYADASSCSNESGSVSPLNFIFTIFEPEKCDEWIDQRYSKFEEYSQEKQAMDQRLEEESSLFGDMNFVDIEDTYRNIPLKMLLFYSWLNENLKFTYFIKTDDDCYLQVDNILKALEESDPSSSKLWWGNFRVGWAVDRFGKWAEHDYPSVAYPAFACGSGNMLSSDVIEWIARNAGHLHCYQGEDVSAGIWLSAILPSYINDNRWICDSECSPDMFASAEHSVEELRNLWRNWSECKNPCGCG